jgi:hypothetical protein
MIKHYIVTYNNNEVLNTALQSLIPTLKSYDKSQYKLFIINNHTNFSISEYFVDKVEVLHNQTRPDFSTGHLTRNWNQAIINGFVDLNNPNCDIVITSQNDTTFTENFLERVLEAHKSYDVVQLGAGDSYMSYTPEAIKKVGLWDERFCNIGYQESDYFFRSFLYNRDKVSINDFYHGRLHNQLSENGITTEVFKSGHLRGEPSHLESLKYHKYQLMMYLHKWHHVSDDINKTSLYWHDLKSFSELKPKVPSYIYYPYFEKDYYKQTFISQKYVGWETFFE